MDFKLYRAYFKHQAESLIVMSHADTPGSRVFEVISVDEAFGDLRSSAKEKDFVFRLIEPIYAVGDQGQAPVRKSYQVGFVIIKYHSPRSGGKESYYQAMEDAEAIVDKIIAKIIADSHNMHPLFFSSMDSRQDFQVTPLISTEDGVHSGWICTFTIDKDFDTCVYVEDWTDEGVTPLDLFAEPEE